jgi:hypothetical protein
MFLNFSSDPSFIYFGGGEKLRGKFFSKTAGHELIPFILAI